ncbi:MAG: hypothetical protein KJT01_12450 [Gemmatimonadetes bacterium]|nr:hypothetical protein [Gemmatimonadota bacterium]
MRSTIASLPLVIALLGAVACTQEPMAPAVPADLSPSLNTGAVHAVIEQGDRSADGKIRYTVRILARKGEMASYQGVLTFPAGSVAIDAVSVPETADGEVHMVNREQLAEGKIRFAGYAPEELSTSEAFSFTVTPRGAGTPDFAVALDVAGSPEGVAKPAALLRGTREVRDKNGNVLR